MISEDFKSTLIKMKEKAIDMAIIKAGKHSRDKWDNIECVIDEEGITVKLTDYCGKFCHVDDYTTIDLTWEEINNER